MRPRRAALAILAWGVWAMPAVALAQDGPRTTPNKNWVFLLAVVTLLGFLAFMAFVALYYMFAVVARNRKFATQAVTGVGTASSSAVAPAPPKAPAVPAAVAAPAATPAAAPAAAPQAAPAPAAAAPSAPAAAPAAPAAEAAAPAGGIPRIDPNNLPDGIDAVTRGRLKKLAVLQDRGQEPPAELLEELKSVLPQVAGAPVPAPAAARAEPAAPAAEAAPAPAEAAPAEAAPAEAPAAEAPAAPPADTGDIPRIDPTNLPDGIDAVARGRLKKLAVFQERGDQPPADLIEKLKPILDQIKG